MALLYGMDVTRSSTGRPNGVDIMFVRNIMPTNSAGESLTGEVGLLNSIHTSAIRKRTNSLRDSGGEIHIGMSGAPGLSDGQRDSMNNQTLFKDYGGMNTAAKESRFFTSKGFGKEYPRSDMSVQPMKNNGADLGVKPTYYLTFQK